MPAAPFVPFFPHPHRCVALLYAGRVFTCANSSPREASDVSAKPQPKEYRLGRYVLKRPLGKGGSGQLYLAWGINATGEPLVCVVKLPQLRLATDEKGCARFLYEGRLALRLGAHPNIVLVIDVGLHGRMPFLVMEYVDGIDLDNLCKRLRTWKRPLSTPSIHNILASVAAGLHHAHSGATIDGRPVKIVHRDVTSANVLVSRIGMVKLIDFGIGRAEADATTGHHWRGTPRYMSPEHLNCDPCPEMDIYGFGVIAWQLLENRVFREDLEGTQHYPAIVYGLIPEMRSTDRHLVEIIKSCLDLDRRSRPTAAEVSEALARCPGHSRDPSVLEQELAPIIGTRRSSGASKEQLAALPPSPELIATLAAFESVPPDAGMVASYAQSGFWDTEAEMPEAPDHDAEPEPDAPRSFRKRGPKGETIHPAADAQPNVSSTEITREYERPTSATTKPELEPSEHLDGQGSGPLPAASGSNGMLPSAQATLEASATDRRTGW